MHDGFKLNVWDIGGQKSIRPYWRNYYDQTGKETRKTNYYKSTNRMNICMLIPLACRCAYLRHRQRWYSPHRGDRRWTSTAPRRRASRRCPTTDYGKQAGYSNSVFDISFHIINVLLCLYNQIWSVLCLPLSCQRSLVSIHYGITWYIFFIHSLFLKY